MMSVEKYDWAIQKSTFEQTNQDSTFSRTRENSKMFNITSKMFNITSKGIFLLVIPVRIIVPWINS